MILVWVIVSIIVIIIQSQRNTVKRLAAAEAARLEAEEQIELYHKSWAAARSSENIDALVRCGEYVIKAAQLWQPNTVESVAWDVYKEILSRLKTRPELKPTALAIGRAAYAARRPGGALTIYDEQAIQNDILAHAG
jgi:hypothetical protein